MDHETLRAKIEQLKASHAKTLANLHAIEGAIQFAESLLPAVSDVAASPSLVKRGRTKKVDPHVDAVN